MRNEYSGRRIDDERMQTSFSGWADGLFLVGWSSGTGRDADDRQGYGDGAANTCAVVFVWWLHCIVAGVPRYLAQRRAPWPLQSAAIAREQPRLASAIYQAADGLNLTPLTHGSGRRLALLSLSTCSDFATPHFPHRTSDCRNEPTTHILGEISSRESARGRRLSPLARRRFVRTWANGREGTSQAFTPLRRVSYKRS